MEVFIKTFDVQMEVKNNGMELEVRSSDGSKQLGDCYVTKTGLTWCTGRTRRGNGIKISWDDLSLILESTVAKKAAVKAAKAV